MKEIYVIESVISPGSFWAESYEEFKGWLFATKFTPEEGGKTANEILKACKIEPCTIRKVYDKQ